MEIGTIALEIMMRRKRARQMAKLSLRSPRRPLKIWWLKKCAKNP